MCSKRNTSNKYEQLQLLRQELKDSEDKSILLQQEIKENEDMSTLLQQRDIKIKEFVDNCNIEDEICNINSIYEEVLNLNYLIGLTSHVSLESCSDLKKEDLAQEKLDKLRRILSSFNDLPYLVKDVKERNAKHATISLEINELQIEIQNMDTPKIQYIWGIIFRTKNNLNIVKPLHIKAFEIIKFNLQKKKRLKEIYNDWNNEEYIKDLLAAVYEKSIRITLKELDTI